MCVGVVWLGDATEPLREVLEVCVARITVPLRSLELLCVSVLSHGSGRTTNLFDFLAFKLHHFFKPRGSGFV